MKPKNEVKEEEEDEEDYDPSQVEVINDNWRRVIPDDSSKPYFFNIQTQESSWVYPVM